MAFNEKKLETVTNKFVDDCESIMNDLFTASGIGFMNIIDELDEPMNLAMISASVKMYKHGKTLLALQAKMMDEMLDGIKVLKEEVSDLKKQNENLSSDFRRQESKLDKLANKGN